MSLCDMVEQYDVRLDRNTLDSLVAYVAYNLAEQGRLGDALAVLQTAINYNVAGGNTKRLYDIISMVKKYDDVAGQIGEAIDSILRKFAGKQLSPADLQRLEQLAQEEQQLAGKLESLGLQPDTRIISIAEDVYNLLSALYSGGNNLFYTVQDELANILNTLNSTVKTINKANSVDALGSTLASAGTTIYNMIRNSGILQQIDALISTVSSVPLKTDKISGLRDNILRQLEYEKYLVQMLYSIAGDMMVLGNSISNIQSSIENVYQNASSFYANDPAINAFENLMVTMLNQARQTSQEAHQLAAQAASYASSQDQANLASTIAGIADRLYTLAYTIAKNVRYETTYNDYRWNRIWQDIMNYTGIDLGHISKESVARNKFDYCTPNSCVVEPRPGIAGAIARHAPNELVRFWVSVEDVTRDIQQFWKHMLDHNSGLIQSIIADIGFVGAQALSMLASTFVPQMLAESIEGLRQLIHPIVEGVKTHNMQEVKQGLHNIKEALFGSKEAILTFIAATLLFEAARGALGRVIGDRPFLRELLARLGVGDLLGAALLLIERLPPVARAMELVEEAAGDLLRRSAGIARDIAEEALKRSKILERLRGVISADLLSDVIKRAISESKNLEEAIDRMDEILREEGLQGLKEDASVLAKARVQAENILKTLSTGVKERIAKLLESRIPESVAENIEKMGTLQLARQLLKTGLVREEDVEALSRLERLANRLEEAGKEGVAGYIRDIVRGLKGEIERLSELKQLRETLDELDRIREKAEQHGLWRDTVEMYYRNLKPGREFLKRARENVTENMEKLREQVEGEYQELYSRVQERLGQAGKLGEALEKTVFNEEVSRDINNIAGALREAGLGDLADELERIYQEELSSIPGKYASPEQAVSSLLERLASEIEREAGKSARTARLVASRLERVVEQFERTPYGRILKQLEGTLKEKIETVKPKVPKASVEEAVRNAIEDVLIRKGRLQDVLETIDSRILDAEAKIADVASKIAGMKELLSIIKNAVRVGNNIDEVVNEAVREAEEKGISVTPEMERLIREYASLEKTRADLENLMDTLEARAENMGTATLEQLQKLVNDIASLDVDVAWEADFNAMKNALKQLVNPLEELLKLARKGEIPVTSYLEDVEEKLRQVDVIGPRENVLRRITEWSMAESSLASTIDQLIDSMAKAFGEDAVKNLRELADQFKRELSEGKLDTDLLKKMLWETRKLKIKHIPDYLRAQFDRLKMALSRLKTRLAGSPEEAALAGAFDQLSDIIKEIEEKAKPSEEETGKTWSKRYEKVEAGEYRVVKAPPELYEEVSRILQEREKTWTITTDTGDRIVVKRTIDIDPSGRLHVHYEIDFPGGRKMTYDYVAKAERNGKIETYENYYYDPELEEALLKYREELSAGRLDEEGRLGEDVDYIVKHSIEEIDPDFKLLERVGFIKDSFHPFRLIAEGMARLANTLMSGAMTVSKQEKIENIVKQVAKAPVTNTKALAYAVKEKAPYFGKIVDEIRSGRITPEAGLLLSLEEPTPEILVGMLKPEAKDRIELVKGMPPALSGTVPPDWKITIVKPDWEPAHLPGRHIFYAIPDESEFLKLIPAQYYAEVSIPQIGTVILPVKRINDKLVIIVPPFQTRLPDSILNEIEHPSQVNINVGKNAQIPRLKPITPTPVTSKPGGGTGKPGGPPTTIIPLPLIPWSMLVAGEANYKERERLVI